MRIPFLSRFFGSASPKALAHAHQAAEVARLSAINRDPPPGIGWRCGDQDSEGKWTVWNGPLPVCAFWDENEAQQFARAQNRDKVVNRVEWDDGKYCVNCGSRETDDSIKARGFVNCCPERYVIRETWHVSAERLATGHWHIWRPDIGVDSIVTDKSWPERADAQHEADHRNLLMHRAHAAIANSQPEHPDSYLAASPPPLPMGGQNAGFHTTGFVQVEGERRPARATGDWDASWSKADRLAAFLDVPIPEGVRAVVGPHKSPDDGNWWVFTRAGPYRGYTRKANAQAAAERVNNAPQT